MEVTQPLVAVQIRTGLSFTTIKVDRDPSTAHDEAPRLRLGQWLAKIRDLVTSDHVKEGVVLLVLVTALMIVLADIYSQLEGLSERMLREGEPNLRRAAAIVLRDTWADK